MFWFYPPPLLTNMECTLVWHFLLVNFVVIDWLSSVLWCCWLGDGSDIQPASQFPYVYFWRPSLTWISSNSGKLDQLNKNYSAVALVPHMSTTVYGDVVLTSRICSSMKYSQLGQSANICDVSSLPTCTLYMCEKSQWQEINIYPNWLYCMLELYVELTICHTTPDIRCTQLTNYDYKSHVLSATNNVLLPLPALQLQYVTPI